MKLEEFKEIFEVIQGRDTTVTLQGESGHAISVLRNKGAVYHARIGLELARIKNDIRTEYIRLRALETKTSIKDCEELSEEKVNSRFEVTRYELQYLLDSIKEFTNACASSLNTLKGDQ